MKRCCPELRLSALLRVVVQRDGSCQARQYRRGRHVRDRLIKPDETSCLDDARDAFGSLAVTVDAQGWVYCEVAVNPDV